MNERGDRGRLVRVSGPVVVAEGLRRARLYDLVVVGEAALLGELVRLQGDRAVIQVYEDTTGLEVGDVVVGTGAPLQIELGPGLLGAVFDGVQRRLSTMAGDPGELDQPFLSVGGQLGALDATRLWQFHPVARSGQEVVPGDVLGTVEETPGFTHRILVPPGMAGTVTSVAAGGLHVDDVVARIGEHHVRMRARWPVRRPRPVSRRIDLDVPLVTGQRVIDTLFPIARGGTATLPGGFGTGKTVLEQSLAQWADADVVVYVACGERGNELAGLLATLPTAADPRTGTSLMGRTIIVANTSNMPVAAREASVYTGITLAEYFRDQGCNVVLLADSTSRWAEALREISARLEEMPGEEGYPAYLPARLADFYERAGAVVTLGSDERTGAVTVIGAVSPPGADFSEPVAQYSQRLAGTYWALDIDLARRRHYPAVQWNLSYSHYELSSWFAATVDPSWSDQRAWAIALLREEQELLELVQLLGPEGLTPAEQVTLRTGRLLREGFLQQSAFSPVDAWCPPSKQFWMLHTIRHAQRRMIEACERGMPFDRVSTIAALSDVTRLRDVVPADVAERVVTLVNRLDEELGIR